MSQKFILFSFLPSLPLSNTGNAASSPLLLKILPPSPKLSLLEICSSKNADWKDFGKQTHFWKIMSKGKSLNYFAKNIKIWANSTNHKMIMLTKFHYNWTFLVWTPFYDSHFICQKWLIKMLIKDDGSCANSLWKINLLTFFF